MGNLDAVSASVLINGGPITYVVVEAVFVEEDMVFLFDG